MTATPGCTSFSLKWLMVLNCVQALRACLPTPGDRRGFHLWTLRPSASRGSGKRFRTNIPATILSKAILLLPYERFFFGNFDQKVAPSRCPATVAAVNSRIAQEARVARQRPPLRCRERGIVAREAAVVRGPLFWDSAKLFLRTGIGLPYVVNSFVANCDGQSGGESSSAWSSILDNTLWGGVHRRRRARWHSDQRPRRGAKPFIACSSTCARLKQRGIVLAVVQQE